MWQVEDIIRANNMSLDKIKELLVEPYNLPAESKAELVEWYDNLIEMMRLEEVKEKGHLQINNNVLINLTDLHLRLMKSSRLSLPSSSSLK